MNLQPRRETIVSPDEFLLNTQGLMYKVGGISLLASAFTGTVKGGTAVMENGGGLFIPYADNAGVVPANTQIFITAGDVVIKTGVNAVTGAIVKGYLNTAKLTGVTPALKAAMNQRYTFG